MDQPSIVAMFVKLCIYGRNQASVQWVMCNRGDHRNLVENDVIDVIHRGQIYLNIVTFLHC